MLRDDSSKEGEDASPFNYYMPDYRGQVGVEAGFDAQLRGRPGAEAVLVNNLGYRQTENVWSQPEPGHNVVLTIDLDIQQAAERSLAAHQGADARAAVVVMDVRTGDVLAMVSSPAINPDYAANEPARLSDSEIAPANQPRRRRKITRPAPFSNPSSAWPRWKTAWIRMRSFTIRRIRKIRGTDTADSRRRFQNATPRHRAITISSAPFMHSSNTYFITIGLRTPASKISSASAEKFHFGERIGLPTRQETRGISRLWNRCKPGLA